MNDRRDPFEDEDGDSGPPTRRGWLLLGLLAAGVGTLLVMLVSYNPNALNDDYSLSRLVKLLVLVALVGSVVLHARHFRWSTVAKQAGAWIGIALVLAVGYAFRDEFGLVTDRLAGEFQPDRPMQDAAGDVTIRRAEDRHFYVRAMVDGQPVQFLIDTGASDVVLSPADAKRLRFDPSRLRFTRTYNTANGEVRGAPVRLGEIRIGPISMRDVRASVNGAEMDHSLLGMSYLGRLSGYEVKRRVLTLRR